MLIDTHAHLYDSCYDNTALFINSARDKDIQKIIMPNLNITTVESMLTLQKAYPHILAYTIGLHPCYVDHHFKKQLEKLEDYLQNHNKPCVGIGEIGLDFYHSKQFKNQQYEAFHIQIQWAKKYQLPIIIHCRNAFDEVIEIIKKNQDGQLKGIFHCFGGTKEEAKKIIDLNFYIGIGGIVTFKKSALTESLPYIPTKHIVLETDSPYLAPKPHRGKKNEPAFLIYVAKKCAEIQKISLEMISTITTKNAQKIFWN